MSAGFCTWNADGVCSAMNAIVELEQDTLTGMSDLLNFLY